MELISLWLGEGDRKAGLLIPARGGVEREEERIKETPWELTGAERARPTGKCMYLDIIMVSGP